MKKLLFVGILTVFALSGCQSNYEEGVEKEQHNGLRTEEDVFALKEKCNKYLESENDRFMMKEKIISDLIYLEGIFYSKKIHTCVAKWNWVNRQGGQFYSFEDTLTGSTIKSFNPFILDSSGLPNLDLALRDNDELEKEVDLFEKSLELIK